MQKEEDEVKREKVKVRKEKEKYEKKATVEPGGCRARQWVLSWFGLLPALTERRTEQTADSSSHQFLRGCH